MVEAQQSRQREIGQLGPPSQDEICDELARILDSPEFSATSRRREMLKYLVEKSVAADGRPIKGYTIGVEVFGRDEGYDPQADPVVRMEARRLRRDLDGYYGLAGRNNPLRISIPKGQYVPKITRTEPVDHQAEGPLAAAATATTATMADSAATIAARIPRWWAIAVALVGFAIIAGLGYLVVNDGHPWAGERAVRTPALAVLPFAALSTRLDDSFLGEGIASQIVRELNRFPDLRLYLSPSGSEDNNPANPLELGKALGVDYVVAGDLRSEDSALHITSRLVDAHTGEVIWTESYERDVNPRSILAVQGDIATGIASSLGQSYGVIRTDLASRLSDRFTSDMASYECVLRAYSYRRGFPEALYAPVLNCLEETVRRDPDYAEAWAMLAWLYLDTARFGYAAEGEARSIYQKALDTASHSVRLDGKSVLGLKALSAINHYMGNYDDGEKYAREALAANPNDPDALAQLGWRLAVRGNFAEGIPYLQLAIERSVNPPGWYYHLIAVDHYMEGRYSEMLSAAERGNASDDSFIRWSLVAVAQGALGNEGAAHQALAKMTEVWPEAAGDPAAVFRGHGATDEIVEALVDGLRNAGWSEPATQ